MSQIVKVTLAGGIVRDAIELDFEPAAEPWCEYRLADGGRVRFRAVATKLLRVLDAQGVPAFDENGDPQILARYATQVVASG